MLIDGIFCSQAIDKTGELLIVDGVDLSSFKSGKGGVNFEHRSGIKGTPLDVIGKVTYAHKILVPGDCENDRQKWFYNQTKLPCIYGIIRLFDESGHPGAIAVAAMVRDAKEHDEPLSIGFSIEGETLERDPHDPKILAQTIARDVAVTLKPCAASCVADLLEDQRAKPSAETMGKSEMVRRDVEISPTLAKAFTVSGAGAAPGALVGGAALSKEDRIKKAVPSPVKLEGAVAGLQASLAGASDHPRVVELSSKDGQRIGRYASHRGALHHLEDPHGSLSKWIPEGPLDESLVSRISALESDPRINARVEGSEPEPQAPFEPLAKDPPEKTAAPSYPQPRNPNGVWHYHRKGETQPHVLESRDGSYHLDGRPVPEFVLKLMLANVGAGSAKIAHLPSIKKSEGSAELPDEDSTVRGVGNLASLKATAGKPGVWASVGVRDVDGLSKTHGVKAVEGGVRSVGEILRDAADTVGGKVFRGRAGSYAVHLPSYEHGLRWMHALREGVKKMVPLGGADVPSIEIGLGTDHAAAEQARSRTEAGRGLSAHSDVQGKQGQIPI